MHLSEGEIQAYFDAELSSEAHEKAALHIESCPKCSGRAEIIRNRMQRVQAQFASLEPTPSQAPSSTSHAHARLNAQIRNSEKENMFMRKNLIPRLPKAAWGALAIVTILAVSLTFPSVRALANSFLGLFRVEQIQVIEFDADKVSEQMESSSQLEQILGDNVQFEELGEPQEVASAAEASDLAGFEVRLPEDMDSEMALTLQPGANMTFNADIDLIQTVLDEIGRSDIQLPPGIDGAQVELDIPASVTAQYGQCDFEELPKPEDGEHPIKDAGREMNCTSFMQVPSPTISAPPGLDIAKIGEAYLQLLGMSQEEAESFSQNVDWTTTFIVPIPQYYADYEEVTVDGVTGTYIQNKYASWYVLLWVKDGIVHSLSGPENKAEALSIANSLK
jgi:hypothetical protein